MNHRVTVIGRGFNVGWPSNWSAVGHGYESMSDQALLQAIRQGDQRAFGAFFISHWDYAYFTCRKLCHDTELAEEAAQDGFLNFLEHEKYNVGGRSTIRSYLSYFMRWATYDRIRTEGGRRGQKIRSFNHPTVQLDARMRNKDGMNFKIHEVIADTAGGPLTELELNEALQIVESSAASVNIVKSAIFRAVFFKGERLKVAGERFNLTESRACQIYHEVLGIARQRLIQEGYVNGTGKHKSTVEAGA